MLILSTRKSEAAARSEAAAEADFPFFKSWSWVFGLWSWNFELGTLSFVINSLV
jgi:hypothetical protein